MAKICRSCGAENRDTAVFCSSCGVPLPADKKNTTGKIAQKAGNSATGKFWLTVLSILLFLGVIAYLITSKLKESGELKTTAEMAEKYDAQDQQTFEAIAGKGFSLMMLKWNMSAAAIKKIYPYMKDSTDPDFALSSMVNQSDFKSPLPHANFMSLGIYDDKLYAIKYEFGESAEFQRQVIKIPDAEAILYGRYEGLKKVFTAALGRPAFLKEEAAAYPLHKRLGLIKEEKLPDGKPSNIYMYWTSGDTKTELVLFGSGGKMHLTVRFLYIPVWNIVGK
jgi:cbb3-type cytochrome oxidase subunit 3